MRKWIIPLRLIAIFYCFLASGLLMFMVGEAPAAPAGAGPAELVVEVIGTSRVQGEDMDASRTLAISNGLVNAIDRGIADLMPLALRIEKFKALNGTLFSEPDRFVVGYKVLTETVSGKTFRVMVQATVSMAALRKHLTEAKMLPEETTTQRILLLITEQNIEDPAPNFWWAKGNFSFKGVGENRIAEVLQQQGFRIVAHDQSPPQTAEEKSGAPLLSIGANPSDADAVSLGKRFQADVVIVATATAQNVGNIMGETQKSYKGALTGRMLRTDTGEKIGDIFRSAVAVGPDPQSGGRQALSEAGAAAAEAIGPQVKTGWQKKTDVNVPITLIVEGTRNLSNFVNFRSVLKEMPMVTELEPIGIKPNEATLSAKVKGTPKALADALMLKSNEGFSISISEITPDTLRLALVPKTP